LHAAFDGATTLFLLTHYLEDMVELQHNAIAAARDAGVTHVVKVSASRPRTTQRRRSGDG
jgi:uncharacterized protein YbjT (DUF2867 family)